MEAAPTLPYLRSRRCTCGAAPGRGRATALGAADFLTLAAAPACAMMALLAWVADDGSPALCQGPQAALSSGGMATMYLLMSAFHSAAWLKRIARGRKLGDG